MPTEYSRPNTLDTVTPLKAENITCDHPNCMVLFVKKDGNSFAIHSHAPESCSLTTAQNMAWSVKTFGSDKESHVTSVT